MTHPPQVRRYERFAKQNLDAGRIHSARADKIKQNSGTACRAGNKGHAENEYNNRCDELAVAESRKYK